MSNEKEHTSGCCTTCRKGKNPLCSYKDRLLTKWADNSTVHGVDHIFSGKSTTRRIVWALVVLGAIAGCLYGIIDRAIYFSNSPTATTVTANINENGVPFPAVTVCNLSPVRKSYSDGQNLTSFLSYLFNTDSVSLQDQFRDEDCRSLVGEVGADQSNLALRDVFINGRFDLVRSCLFGHSREVVDCSMSLQQTLTPSGLCYTFNGINTESQSPLIRSSGERYGLRMLFNISQSDYIHSFNADAGIKVAIHNRNEEPEPQQTGISVPPGSHASIALYPQASISRPEISNCAPLDTNLEFFPSRSYSMSACKLNNYYEKSVELCGCTDVGVIPSAGMYSNVRNCTVSDACCLFDAFLESDQNSTCLPVCESLIYEPSVSYSQYPSNRAAHILSLFVDESPQTLEYNILAINVYFGSLHTIVSSTDYSYRLTALLADIGGSLALFIGASVISLVEIGFLFFDEFKRGFLFSGHKAKDAFESHELTTKENKDEEDIHASLEKSASV